MKVLLVNGSPHPEGCTHTALMEIAAALDACGIGSEEFWIGNQPLAGCIACGVCGRNSRCFRDDAVNRFLDKAAACDAFVFGTPVHYASAAGAMVSFMDRAFYAGGYRGGALAGKPAAAVVSARRGGNTATFDQMNKYFAISHMPIVTSQYWNMVHGNTPDQVRQDAEGLQTMRSLARNMTWLLRCIEAGRAAGVEEPEYEPPMRTNFIR